MGRILVPQDPPVKLSEFKNLAAAPEQYTIPEIGSKRTATDRGFFFAFLFAILIVVTLLIYSFVYVDFKRWKNGFDTCGNVCGVKNEPVPGINCSGVDFRNEEYLVFDEDVYRTSDESFIDKVTDFKYFNRHCAASCDGQSDTTYIADGKRCYPVGIDTAIEESYLLNITSLDNKPPVERQNVFAQIAIVSILALAVGGIILVIFRYAVAFVVWGVVLGTYTFFTVIMLYACFSEKYQDPGVLIFMAIIWIIITIFMIISFKRIPFVISIFKEAQNVIFSIPTMFFVSMITFFCFIVVLFLFAFAIVIFGLAGVLTEIRPDMYSYEPNAAMMIGLCLDIIVTIWILFFIEGIQVMVIAGATSTYYFTRDKTFLGRPVMDSFGNVTKYHLGTAAFGSLVITIVKIIRFIVNFLMNRSRTRPLAECCMNLMQSFLLFVSRNAYILTAIHGEPFLKSGKRAVQLIYHNINDTLSINTFGDFVLFMAKILVVIITNVIYIAMFDYTVHGLFFGVAISLILASIIFNTFEIVIDTIFMCYCEDCYLNDGIDRPYYMSTELMQFFDESKSVFMLQQ